MEKQIGSMDRGKVERPIGTDRLLHHTSSELQPAHVPFLGLHRLARCRGEVSQAGVRDEEKRTEETKGMNPEGRWY